MTDELMCKATTGKSKAQLHYITQTEGGRKHSPRRCLTFILLLAITSSFILEHSSRQLEPTDCPDGSTAIEG